MPIELRELVIRTTIVSGTPPAPPPAEPEEETRRAIIAACLDQVWEKLERKAER